MATSLPFVRVIDPMMVPPGGSFEIVMPKTGVTVRAKMLPELKREAARHYDINQVPYERAELDIWVERTICEGLPQGWCTGGVGRIVFSLEQVKKATTLLFDRVMHVLSGGTEVFVPQPEAERRAEICQTCPKNDRTFCSSCKGLGSWLLRLMGPWAASSQKLSTKYDELLGSCQVCHGCMLKTKVHYSLDLLGPRSETDEYPTHCWINEWKTTKSKP